jgi:integrase
MPVRRNAKGNWFYRKRVRLPNGKRVDITGTPSRNTRLAAEQAERAHIDRVLNPPPEEKEVPTFGEWFWGNDAEAKEPQGRFWREWVIGRGNKPGERVQKISIYRNRLAPKFGTAPLNEIGVAAVARFRADLVEEKLQRKTINNILAVLSKALRYALDAEVIERAPKIGIFKAERPEIEAWEIEDYARIVEAARVEGEAWHVAVCLAGEAGLRIGEVRALRWEDIDMRAGTITVSRQARHGVEGTPKGGTRRVVPMTEPLREALRSLSTIRRGHVVRNMDGSPLSDGQTCNTINRIHKRAGVPARRGEWHLLRHTFGTHAALFGVNPWRLQAWLGHKRIDETMLYVHVAEAHRRDLPPAILAAAAAEVDPDRRILAMLGSRCISVASAGVTKIGQVA